MDFLNRTWAEIQLTHIQNNFDRIRSLAGPDTKIMCVVKADAYGHGAVPIARFLDKQADYFAVSNIEEGVELRRAGIVSPILILGYTPVSFAADLAKHRLTQTLLNYDYAVALSRQAVKQQADITCHIKIDTGMNRIGLEYDDSRLPDVCKMPGLTVEGVFTHFCSSDKDGDADGAFTQAQFERFMHAVKIIEDSGFSIAIRHCCNSAATVANPDYRLDMVRAGIILYGLQPSDAIAIPGFLPAMNLKSTVAMIKAVEPGETLSYGRTFEATRPMQVATLPIGYADGYLRAFANGAMVLIGGQPMPVVGRICMDQCMVDITGHDVRCGDTVTLFGYDRPTVTENTVLLPVERLARLAHTINYELICVLSKRVGRVYYQGENIVQTVGLLDYQTPDHTR